MAMNAQKHIVQLIIVSGTCCNLGKCIYWFLISVLELCEEEHSIYTLKAKIENGNLLYGALESTIPYDDLKHETDEEIMQSPFKYLRVEKAFINSNEADTYEKCLTAYQQFCVLFAMFAQKIFRDRLVLAIQLVSALIIGLCFG